MRKERMDSPIFAYPVRIIPFDLGRGICDADVEQIKLYVENSYSLCEISSREAAILKGFSMMFRVDDGTKCYVYLNGIVVVVINDDVVSFVENYKVFAIAYGENRKRAHTSLFRWEHDKSGIIWDLIRQLRLIVQKNTKKGMRLRKSASEEFENKGLSYIMTLSLFDMDKAIVDAVSFKNYPDWLKSNIYALLDPSVLYLEDSSVFESVSDISFDLSRILDEMELSEDLVDYERHRHINVYMSWAAVVAIGQLQDNDKEEYTTLEVQLQCDWFYIYCLDKALDDLPPSISKKDMVSIQTQQYEVDLMENRLFDFDDSSMPTRVLDIQRGLVDTSGLCDNIAHLKRKTQYIIEKEHLNSELHQKRLARESEVLLFIIAFIEIAPTVAEYGNSIYSNAGTITNILIVILGIILMIRKSE